MMIRQNNNCSKCPEFAINTLNSEKFAYNNIFYYFPWFLKFEYVLIILIRSLYEIFLFLYLSYIFIENLIVQIEKNKRNF